MYRFLFAAILALSATLRAEVRAVEEKDFPSEISKGTVLADFYGPWCGPCKRLAPVLDQLSEEMGNKVTFIKINIDKAHSLTQKYEVTGVPVLILFKNGKEVRRIVGFHDKSAVKKFIESGSDA